MPHCVERSRVACQWCPRIRRSVFDSARPMECRGESKRVSNVVAESSFVVARHGNAVRAQVPGGILS